MNILRMLSSLAVCLISVTAYSFDYFVFKAASVTSEKTDEGLVIRIPEDSADIKRVLPIYEFKNDVEGRFLYDYLVSMTELPYRDPVIVIKNTNDLDVVKFVDFIAREAEYKGMNLPENEIFLRLSSWQWQDNFKRCKGVVILPKNHYGLIYSDSKEWLDKLHLMKSNECVTAYYGQSCKEKGVAYIDCTTSYDIWAVLTVLNNGKVDPLMMYNLAMSLQSDASLITKFAWIEDFYKKHNLPEGCGYYNQPILDPRLRKRDETPVMPAPTEILDMK